MNYALTTRTRISFGAEVSRGRNTYQDAFDSTETVALSRKMKSSGFCADSVEDRSRKLDGRSEYLPSCSTGRP